VTRRCGDLVRYAAGADFAAFADESTAGAGSQEEPAPPVPLSALDAPAVVNVGLETFAASLAEQGAPVVHVEWRPPAGGDDRLASILRRMKS
jgi:FdrA protein